MLDLSRVHDELPSKECKSIGPGPQSASSFPCHLTFGELDTRANGNATRNQSASDKGFRFFQALRDLLKRQPRLVKAPRFVDNSRLQYF